MSKKYDGLQDFYMASRIFGAPLSGCVDWAAETLEEDREDEALRSLASLDRRDEPGIKIRAEALVGGEAPAETSAEYWGGRYLARLAHAYFERQMGIEALGSAIEELDAKLDSPDWLGILKRTSAFCADIPGYREAFEAELKYLSRIWLHAGSLPDFKNAYDCRISSKHDLR
jgi:hypothetical protein